MRECVGEGEGNIKEGREVGRKSKGERERECVCGGRGERHKGRKGGW